MKYYLLRRYTPEGKYCSHDYYEVEEGVNIKDYFDKTDVLTEVSKEEFDRQQSFYKQTIRA